MGYIVSYRLLNLMMAYEQAETCRSINNIITEKLVVFWLPYTVPLSNMYFEIFYKFVWYLSHTKKSRARYDHKSISVFLQYTHYSYHVLIKLWIFSTDFRKILEFKFHEIPFTGSRFVQCGPKDVRTDGHTKSIQRNGTHDTANSHLSQLCEVDLICYVILVPFVIISILRISLT